MTSEEIKLLENECINLFELGFETKAIGKVRKIIELDPDNKGANYVLYKYESKKANIEKAQF